MTKKEETVKVTVTLELPKKVHNFLLRFAAFLDVPLEEILRRELKGDIPGFYQNEVFLNNIESAIRNHDCAKYFQLDR